MALGQKGGLLKATGGGGGGLLTASNGLTAAGTNVRLGGSLTQNTNINGAFSLTFGQTVKLVEFLATVNHQVKLEYVVGTKSNNLLIDGSNSVLSYYDSATGSFSNLQNVEGASAMSWEDSGTNRREVRTNISGVGITTQLTGTNLAYLRNTNLTTDRIFEFPDQNGLLLTSTDTSDVLSIDQNSRELYNSSAVSTLEYGNRTFRGDWLFPNSDGLYFGPRGVISTTLTGSATIFGNSIKSDYTIANNVEKSSNAVGHFMRMKDDIGISFHTDLVGVVGTNFADNANQRLLVSSTGISLSNIGSIYNAILKNTNLTADVDIELPITSGTLALTSSVASLPTVATTVTANSTLAYTGVLEQTQRGNSSAGTFTTTLPTAVGKTGYKIVLKKIGTGNNPWVIAANGAETMDGTNTIQIIVQDVSVTLQSDGTNWILI